MTNAFVLDASVALGWALDDASGSGGPARDALENCRTEAVVPTLWRYEVSAALLANERRARLSSIDVDEFLESLELLPIYEEDAWPSGVSLVRQGRVHGLTAYDAAYLVLAQRLSIPLATHDRQLRAAAEESEIALL